MTHHLSKRLFFSSLFLLFTSLLTLPATGLALQGTYGYDSLDRLTSVTYQDGTIVNYAYDTAGSLTAEEVIPAVSITDVAPLSALPGDTVTLTGTNLDTTTSITVGGVPVTGFTIVSPTQVDVVLPAGATGGDISLATDTGSASFTGFSYLTITSVASSPTSLILYGPSSTGTLKLSATLSDGSVRDVTGTSTYASSSPSIVSVDAAGVVTALTSGNGIVSATFQGVPVNIPVSSVITTIAQIAPASALPGDTVVIDGLDLNTTTAVTFGGTPAASFTVVSPTQISAVVGSGTTGTITVTAMGGTAVRPGFTLLTVSSIANTNPALTLTGSGSTQQLQITVTLSDGSTRDVTAKSTYASADANIASVSQSGLVTAVSSGSTTVTATFMGVSTTINTTAIVTTITGFAPQAVLDGETVTINGTDLDQATAVSFGGTPATNFTIVSPTQISAVVGAGTSGSITVTTPYETATAPGFTLLSVASITNDLPAAMLRGGGSTQQLAITATLSDGSTRDVTALATYAISDANIATVSVTGQTTAVASGTATVTATWRGVSVQIPVTSVVTTITGFAPQAVLDGETVTINGTDLDQATAVSFGGTPATSFTIVSPTQISAVVGAGTSGSITVTTPYETATAPGFTLLSVASVASATPNVSLNGNTSTQQLTVTANLSDGSTRDVTDLAIYATSDANIATVSTTGLITALTNGSATVTATWHGVSGDTQVTAVFTTITSVVPLAALPGDTVTITGENLDGTTSVTFGGTPATSFTVVSSTQIDAVVGTGATGDIVVTASNGTATHLGFTLLTVSSIANTNPALTLTGSGSTQQLQITATLSDGSTRDVTAKAAYASADANIASVSPNGLVTAVSSGSTTVTATFMGISTTINVTAIVTTITGFAPQAVLDGETVTINGTDLDQATAVSFGGTPATSFTIVSPTQISAVVGAGTSGPITVTTPYETAAAQGFTLLSVASITNDLPGATLKGGGSTQQLQITATLSDGSTRDVTAKSTYASADANIASVSQSGLVTAVSSGSTTVIATFMGVSTTINATAIVTTITGFAPQAVLDGETVTINGTDLDQATAVSFGGTPATIFTIVSPTQISAVVGAGTSGPITVTTPYETATAPGFTLLSVASVASATPTVSLNGNTTISQLTVNATLSDGSTRDVTTLATYTSSNTAVATVSATGLVTALSSGSATIIATWRGVSGQTMLTAAFATITSVAPIAALSGDTVTITGENLDGATSITFGGTPVMSFTVISPTKVIAVIGAGTSGDVVVTAPKGTATLPGFSLLTVTSLANATPAVTVKIAGSTQQLTITATLSDGSTRDVTAPATYATSDANVISISTTGLLTANSSGSATITAIWRGLSIQIPVTSVVTTITGFSPQAVLDGETVTINGTDLDTATSVTFGGVPAASYTVISSTQIIAVAGAGASGTVSVTADGGTATMPGFTLLTVTSIVNDLPNITLNGGGSSRQALITATLSDNSTRDVTAQTTYTTSNANIVFITGSGLLSAVSSGTATITASWHGMSLQIPVTSVVTTIAGFTPNAALDGDTVTINGTDLDQATAVSFGGTPAVSFTVVSPTKIFAVVGNGTSGDVTVTTPYETAIAPGFTMLTVSSIATDVNLVEFNRTGLNRQLTVTALLSDGSVRDITALATYTSSDAKVATVSPNGLVNAIGGGTATLSVTWHGTSATVQVVVRVAKEIAVGFGKHGEGKIRLLDNSLENYKDLGWISTNWYEDEQEEVESVPVLCDLDGDKKDEVIISLGKAAKGKLEVLDDVDTGFAHYAWIQVETLKKHKEDGDHERGSANLEDTAVFAACGNVDGDESAEIILGFDKGQKGRIDVLDDARSGFALIQRLDIGKESGEVRPAACDVDGDGKVEIVLGLDKNAPASLKVFDDATAGFAFLDDVLLSTGKEGKDDEKKSGKDKKNGDDGKNGKDNKKSEKTFKNERALHPSCGDVDGDKRDELVIGSDNTGEGQVLLIDDASTGYAEMGRIESGDRKYRKENGETNPAACDVDGDGSAEILVGFGKQGEGRLEILDDASKGFSPLQTLDVGWRNYNKKNGAVYPACGGLK